MRFHVFGAICALGIAGQASAAEDVDALVGAMLGDTPIIGDLQILTDQIGGRVTGSPSSKAAVDWARARFEQAGVSAKIEPFEMPSQWQELAVSATVSGDHTFTPRVIAKPFSAGADQLSAPLLDAGPGTKDDFSRLGDAARNAWVLVESPLLTDEIGLNGLFAEYSDAAHSEALAFAAGAAGVVFMSSRPNNLLYRLPLLSGKGRLPLLLMERESATRAQRLLRDGKSLSLTASIEVDSGYAYQSANVIGEIRGSSRPDEIVLIGAHLDSHDLGTGALDNGANASMMIDIARQITRLALYTTTPGRTGRSHHGRLFRYRYWENSWLLYRRYGQTGCVRR